MFLSEKHNGLDILIDYLSTTQFIMRYNVQSVFRVVSLIFYFEPNVCILAFYRLTAFFYCTQTCCCVFDGTPD